jgi:acetyl esterase/lipase
MPHGRDQMSRVAEALVSQGIAAWNLGYRRLGAPGGGWPGTLEDAAAGISHLTRLPAEGLDLDLDRVVVVGHSAGGHLALWAARSALTRIRVAAVVGLAPITDLARAFAERLGGGAVAELVGGSPDQVARRYLEASPSRRLPLSVRQLILHGDADCAVPVAHSRDYVRAARAAGDDVELAELVGHGHMEFLDPAGAAFETMLGWVLAHV